MEAAIRLPLTQVYVRNGRLYVEQLTVDDETAARLAADRDDPVRFVVEAIEIGARVLDRELTGVNAEFVRAEFEKTARELDASFVERARRVADRLDEKVDEVFGPEHGHVTKALERHFGDESSVAVQHQVRALLGEAAVQLRDDLRRQFSADGDANPLAGFQNAHLAATKQMADQQAGTLRAMAEKLEAMKLEIAELRSEKQKLVEIAAVVEKGTAKGRTYEEAVAMAIDAIASAQGDDCEAVGDLRGEGGRKGDVVVAIDACAGPARGRIVFGRRTPSCHATARSRSSTPPWRRAARTSRSSSCRRRTSCPPARGRCASSTATRCSSSTTRRTTRAWRWRSRTPWPARGS